MINYKKRYSHLLSLFLVALFLCGMYYNIRLLIYIALAFLLAIFLYNIIAVVKRSSVQKEIKAQPLSTFKTFVEIAAFFFAGLYFLYHLIANLDITDLSLDISTQRKVKGDKMDSSYLVIDLKLNKGPIASVELHSIKAYLYSLEGEKIYDSIIFEGLQKVLIQPEIHTKFSQRWTYTTLNEKDFKEKYRIAANEATQFSGFKFVPDVPFRIEVIVVTRRLKFLHRVNAQYKGSVISLPAFKHISS